ncbi:hypothetical protein EBT16_11435, partial [bacterium]|nr:hypothetical protein [bacterium]
MNLFEKYSEEGKRRKRARDLGISIGEYPTGTLNAITDVKMLALNALDTLFVKATSMCCTCIVGIFN